MTDKICAGRVVFSRHRGYFIIAAIRFPVPRLIRPLCPRFQREGETFPRWNNKALCGFVEAGTKDSRGGEREQRLLEIYGLPRNEGDSSASVMAALSPSALLSVARPTLHAGQSKVYCRGTVNQFNYSFQPVGYHSRVERLSECSSPATEQLFLELLMHSLVNLFLGSKIAREKVQSNAKSRIHFEKSNRTVETDNNSHWFSLFYVIRVKISFTLVRVRGNELISINCISDDIETDKAIIIRRRDGYVSIVRGITRETTWKRTVLRNARKRIKNLDNTSR